MYHLQIWGITVQCYIAFHPVLPQILCTDGYFNRIYQVGCFYAYECYLILHKNSEATTMILNFEFQKDQVSKPARLTFMFDGEFM